MMNTHRKITEIQSRFLDTYLDKSKTTLETFLDYPHKEISEFTDLGWIEYNKFDNVMFIHSAYSCKPHKETVKIWNNLKDLARENDCDRIHFVTSRNPRAFEKLYNAKVIQKVTKKEIKYKMEVVL